MVKIRYFHFNQRGRGYIQSSSFHSSFAFMINIILFMCHCFLTSFTSLISHLYQFAYIKKNMKGLTSFEKSHLYMFIYYKKMICFHKRQTAKRQESNKRTEIYKLKFHSLVAILFLLVSFMCQFLKKLYHNCIHLKQCCKGGRHIDTCLLLYSCRCHYQKIVKLASIWLFVDVEIQNFATIMKQYFSK